ncbi:hypothetical protein BD770DRAFT_401998 [Pilaira anomala]|nr:hypothetical protein BD770DRAFT_401998 [Pilaira anomala]
MYCTGFNQGDDSCRGQSKNPQLVDDDIIRVLIRLLNPTRIKMRCTFPKREIS